MTDVHQNDKNYAHPRVTHVRSAGRRTWLLGACAAAAALAFTSTGRFGTSFGIPSAFADAPASGGLDAFLALSQHLTARTSFNPVLGKRVYDALSKSDSQFPERRAPSIRGCKAHGGVPSDTVTQALQTDTPVLAKHGHRHHARVVSRSCRRCCRM
jgi:hypothetical protein